MINESYSLLTITTVRINGRRTIDTVLIGERHCDGGRRTCRSAHVSPHENDGRVKHGMLSRTQRRSHTRVNALASEVERILHGAVKEGSRCKRGPGISSGLKGLRDVVDVLER